MRFLIFSALFFIFLVSSSYADFVMSSSVGCIEPDIIAYKQCVDAKCGTGYIKPEGCSDTCTAKLNEEQRAYDECSKGGNVSLKNSCQVSLTSDYEGVSADNVSNITFKIEVLGDYDDYAIEIWPKDIQGKRVDVSDKELAFIPDPADENKNYLTPQAAQAVGWCVPKINDAEKQFAKKDFSIVQPPLFFVHGIWSSAEVWSTFKQRAGMDGWWYGDISYESTDDDTYNAKILSDELVKFFRRVRNGELYNGKKISAAKVDIVSHSMGGLVTRYYIGSYLYNGNIRKFLMLGTPNNGEVDLNILSKIFSDKAGNQVWTTVKQLRPGDPFILELNKQPLNPDIEYHTIAGTGWYTYTFSSKLTTWRGDGVVLVDSVNLPSVPLYCTYDTHATGVRWIRLLLSADPIVALRGFSTRDDITITTSEVAYGIAKNALLYGHALSAVDCNEDLYNKQWYIPQWIAWLQSPATLHAYDENGNHVGVRSDGKFENTIGEGVYYSSNSSEIHGQVIKIVGDKKIIFVAKGYDDGEIGFHPRLCKRQH